VKIKLLSPRQLPPYPSLGSCAAAVAVFLLSLFGILACFGQGTITFDGPPIIPPGSDIGVTNYYESGMWFRPIGNQPGDQFGRTGGGVSFFPENGTAYVHAALGDSLQFSFTNGSAFDPVSVDLAEYSTVVPDAVTVHFVGYRKDGTTVTTDFTTDGIIDGTGPVVDFQTFLFPPSFSGFTRVEVPGFGWSLDNLVVRVPEPTAASVLLLSGVLLGASALRRKRRIAESIVEKSQNWPRPD
jgi:hypothetical protein